jgi:hypothetical protein
VQTILSSKRPPSYGVLGGPFRTPFHLNRLFSFSRLSEISVSRLPRESSRYSFISRLFCIASIPRAERSPAAGGAPGGVRWKVMVVSSVTTACHLILISKSGNPNQAGAPLEEP